MLLEVKRLHLARLRGVDGLEWPVHGFVVTHPGGAVLVDTGVGGPQEWLNDWRVVNRSAADALAELDMTRAISILWSTRTCISITAARTRSSRTPPVMSSVRS
jgi:hypothetical protein